MKITCRNESGSILMLTLFTAMFIGIALAGTLESVKQQNLSVHRSMEWNIAMAASESGIEEALSHLRAVQGGNRGTNGWSTNSLTGGHFLMRTNGNTRYSVAISADSAPTVTSTGYSKLNIAGVELTRVVQVTTKKQGRFTKGLVAKGALIFSGQFETDSYDSADPAHSTGGLYDPAKRKDNGDVGSMLTGNSVFALSMSGQAKVYGSLAVTPAGTTEIKSQAALGTSSFVDGGGSGFESGRVSTDLNVSFPPEPIPSSGGAFGLPAGGTVSGTNYTRVFSTGKYTASSVAITGNDKWRINGDVLLIVDKDFDEAGNAFIYIAPGAKLTLYVKQGKLTLSGNGLANATGNAANFTILGNSNTVDSRGAIITPGLTAINISGNGAIVGTIYAPDASFTLSGGGRPGDLTDFSGAAVVGMATGSGHMKFHYDESLANAGGAGNVSIASWREL